MTTIGVVKFKKHIDVQRHKASSKAKFSEWEPLRKELPPKNNANTPKTYTNDPENQRRATPKFQKDRNL